jgi:DDE superfamily endonuclease
MSGSNITQQMKRHAVLVALSANHNDSEIATFLNVSRSFVCKIRNKVIVSDGDVQIVAERKKHSQRFDTIRKDDFVRKVDDIITVNRSKSIRAIAREINVSESTVRRVVHDDIKYKSYVMRRGHFMSAKNRENRLIRSKRLLNNLKHPEEPNILWFFSDEKNFDQDQKVNRKNDRWLCSDPSEVPIVMHTKFPSSVMVFGVVTNEGHVMPPYFFPQGLRVNADAYIETLDTIVKPWIDTVAQGRPYVFQQDSAPAHTASKTQEWLAENFHDFITPNIWPPSSPDLNPLDYFFWGIVERDTNKHAHSTIDSLKTAIKDTVADINKDHVIRACSRFRGRIEAVIKAKGDFIE